MKTGLHEFSLFFKVRNGAALILAARAQLVAQGACNSMRDAEEALPSDA